jgi:hypothetical protein
MKHTVCLVKEDFCRKARNSVIVTLADWSSDRVVAGNYRDNPRVPPIGDPNDVEVLVDTIFKNFKLLCLS